MGGKKAKQFYDEQYEMSYCEVKKGFEHGFFEELQEYVRKNSLQDACALEVGSGRGFLQDIISDYTGIDYSDTVQKYYHKKFVSCSADDMPFENNTFDFVWSYAVLEHIINLEGALNEIIRVTKGGGIVLLRPAWHCRPWATNGYQVRPYSDFGVLGKLYKSIIPILDAKIVRFAYWSFNRFVWLVQYLVCKMINKNYKTKLHVKKLQANYEIFWQSDSDACNSIDNFDIYLYFTSRGHTCKNIKKLSQAFFDYGQKYSFVINNDEILRK